MDYVAGHWVVDLRCNTEDGLWAKKHAIYSSHSLSACIKHIGRETRRGNLFKGTTQNFFFKILGLLLSILDLPSKPLKTI